MLQESDSIPQLRCEIEVPQSVVKWVIWLYVCLSGLPKWWVQIIERKVFTSLKDVLHVWETGSLDPNHEQMQLVNYSIQVTDHLLQNGVKGREDVILFLLRKWQSFHNRHDVRASDNKLHNSLKLLSSLACTKTKAWHDLSTKKQADIVFIFHVDYLLDIASWHPLLRFGSSHICCKSCGSRETWASPTIPGQRCPGAAAFCKANKIDSAFGQFASTWDSSERQTNTRSTKPGLWFPKTVVYIYIYKCIHIALKTVIFFPDSMILCCLIVSKVCLVLELSS